MHVSVPKENTLHFNPTSRLQPSFVKRSTMSRREPKTLHDPVEKGLFAKRVQAREEALSEIIKAFTNNKEHEIAGERFATIMIRCLNSVKKGSAKEICLATKAIGLLAMIIGPGMNAHELYRESLSTYSQALSSKAESVKELETLAIVTLVGAEGFSDTERAMKVIWEFIYPKLGSKTTSSEVSGPVLASAISAWSFLLATVDERQLDHKYWQGSISYLLSLLERRELVRAAVVEALAVILEKSCLEKFSTEVYKAFMHTATHKEITTSSEQHLKDQIVEKLEAACGSKWDVSKLFKEEHSLKSSMRICGNRVSISTLSQLKKIMFIKQFLGAGFEVHIMENEFLRELFDVKAEEAPPTPEIYEPELEEVCIVYFSPEIKKSKCKQKFEKSPNSLLSKARTQLMKNHRLMARERKIGDSLLGEEGW